jgi:hypothetical protein
MEPAAGCERSALEGFKPEMEIANFNYAAFHLLSCTILALFHPRLWSLAFALICPMQMV